MLISNVSPLHDRVTSCQGGGRRCPPPRPTLTMCTDLVGGMLERCLGTTLAGTLSAPCPDPGWAWPGHVWRDTDRSPESARRQVRCQLSGLVAMLWFAVLNFSKGRQSQSCNASLATSSKDVQPTKSESRGWIRVSGSLGPIDSGL